MVETINPSSRLRYHCNVCGHANDVDIGELGRETPDCAGCGSTVRMRAVIGLLSRALFGQTLPIAGFPLRKDLRGVGLSDWDEYACRLAQRMDYTNTYYHQEPRLDITDIHDDQAHSCDFLISTDVFEHVVQPVSKAFAGARRLLKPGGVLVLTVPYVIEEKHTVEHFPELHDWSLATDEAGAWYLRNRRLDGSEEEFRDLTFHGGPGTTLEMRRFSQDSLLAELAAAGFRDIHIANEPMPEIGVVWSTAWSLPVIARA